ncbi:hypothetical protein FGO68_gene2135 [Halteria grandinella]|uniref:Uncharacterized protein n=1 Tax=Halteria grandinella TaxID=5974 RepID=A0A8J8SY52_HALGN|nr:hypothetical protein FGO68_gene2135 [Halteria grandinella]
MDEYTAGRGKNIPQDLKLSIEKLIKAVFDQHGSALMEKAPSNRLPKILEIVQKEKKLGEQQKAIIATAVNKSQIFAEEFSIKPEMNAEISDSPIVEPDRQHSENLKQMEEEEQRELTNMIPTGKQLRRSDIEPPSFMTQQEVPLEFASPREDEQLRQSIQKSEGAIRQSIQKSDQLRQSQQQK